MSPIVVAMAVLTLPARADETYMISGLAVRPLETFKDFDLGPEMVVLPLGSFKFGSTRKQADEAFRLWFTTRNLDPDAAASATWEDPFLAETPQQMVTMDVPIAIGLTEVTREQWAACVADGHCTAEYDERIHFRTPKGPYQEDPRSPITAITFLEMREYVAWLNDKVGASVYRLPTEVEWEYAARAGTETRFAQGETLTREQANFSISSAEIKDGKVVWHDDPGNEGTPVPVDALDAANPWGLRHIAGNVMESTATCWSDTHLGLPTSSAYLSPSLQTPGCRRVEKDGFYLVDKQLSRPARRVGTSEDHWAVWFGFRVVRELGSGSAPAN